MRKGDWFIDKYIDVIEGYINAEYLPLCDWEILIIDVLHDVIVWTGTLENTFSEGYFYAVSSIDSTSSTIKVVKTVEYSTMTELMENI